MYTGRGSYGSKAGLIVGSLKKSDKYYKEYEGTDFFEGIYWEVKYHAGKYYVTKSGNKYAAQKRKRRK